jgi:hypothetical protein
VLPSQQHSLVVQYNGNNETAPLILDNLVIEDQDLTLLPYIPPKKLSKGAIAGIVIGSVIGLFFIIALIYFAKEMRGNRKLARLALEEERAKNEHNQDGAD